MSRSVRCQAVVGSLRVMPKILLGHRHPPGPVPLCLLRSDMGTSRSKAAVAPRCGRITATAQGRAASVANRSESG